MFSFLKRKISIGELLSHLITFFTVFYLTGVLLDRKDHSGSVINRNTTARTLILYAYYEKNQLYQFTLQYFIDVGYTSNTDIDFLFIIQGQNLSVPLPKGDNIIVLHRPQNNCYDFGAYGQAFNYLGGLQALKNYKHFIFVNPSALGPILPKYWPSQIHWSEIFTSRLRGRVHACGPITTCIDNKVFIDTWMFSATYKAVVAAYRDNVFTCFKNKISVVERGEIGFSQSLFKNGLHIDSLLMKHNKSIGSGNDPTFKKLCDPRPIFKDGYSSDDGSLKFGLHPLEVVFYKPIWFDLVGKPWLNHYLNETLTYMKWKARLASVNYELNMRSRRY